jgi:hypothetical protein
MNYKIKEPGDCSKMNRLLQKYNVEEDPTDLAPPWLSPLLSPSSLVYD